MDDNGQRENGRHKADPYNKSLHTQWMMPQHQVKDPHTLKFMAIVAERDKAIQERNIALSEKRAALAERDMAFLHRDAAIAERNTAIMERDNAIATLEYARENGVNANSGTGCSPGCTTLHAVKHMHQQHQHQHQQHHQQQHFQHVHPQQPELSDSPYHHSREMHISEAYPISTNSEGVVKPPKPKRPKKEPKVQDTPAKKTPKSSRKNKKGGGEDLNKQLKVPKQQNEWRDEVGGGEDLNEQASETKHDEWKGQELGLNLVAFDESTMPVPVCSCTGKYQQCYKWGNGGWQSACCTTTMSMYPLPVMENKRHARVGGRKMSGGVFNKLLSRLAADGHDLSVPLDLKDHWAKHGTNRYITIK